MRTNILQSIWLIYRSLWLTFRLSLLAIIKSYLGSTQQQYDALNRKWADGVLKIVKLTYTIHNPYHTTLESNKRYILMSNHASLYDIPLLLVAFPNSVRMVAKKELFRIPIWGQAMRAAGFLSIDRQNYKRAYRDLQDIKDKLQQGIVPWISPEGTRSRDSRLNSFKKGGFNLAIETGAIIIPVGIRGAANVLPAKSLRINVGQQVELHIGQPIDSSAYTTNNCRELMNHVATAIGVAANLPVDHSNKELLPLAQ